MDILAGLPFVILLFVLIFWVINQTGEGVKSVGRTTKAIGEWNDEQLSKREKRKRELEAELRRLQ